MFAMVMLNLMNVAFPKAIYNQDLVPNWTNAVGQAIAVRGGEDLNKVATYLQPGQMSTQIMQTIDAAINYTKDLIGVTDAAIGDIRAENHAAIIAVQQASFIPLENIKANLYQWVEDTGYIWIDMMVAKYGVRNLMVMEKGVRKVVPFDFALLKNVKFQIKIDVGPSSYWSEIMDMQTLDNLLQLDEINFLQYLERAPHGRVPKTDELISEVKAAMDNQKPPEPQPPSTSIKFVDLPVNGQIQLAAQHGINLTPQDFDQMQMMEEVAKQINAPPDEGNQTTASEQIPQTQTIQEG
jgi:hypothetical protein